MPCLIGWSRGRQSTNAYDLRPFFAAVEGLARLDGLLPLPAADAASATAATPNTEACNDGSCAPNNAPQGDAERKPLCADATSVGTENRHKDTGTPATEEGERSRVGGMKDSSPQVNSIEVDVFDYDSIPPTPTKTAPTPAAADARPPASADPNDQALAAEIAALSGELGDDAPRSSLGRARNLRRAAGVSPARFLRLLDEAAARTRDRQASIVKRRRDDQAPNGMPYLFTVLQDLLHPAPASPCAAAPARQRTGRSQRRSRGDGRTASDSAYASWQGTADRLPVIEEHPVWRVALDALAQTLTIENFNTWLATTRVISQEGDLLRIAVADDRHRAWLDQRWRPLIERVLWRVAPGVGVRFEVMAAGAA